MQPHSIDVTPFLDDSSGYHGSADLAFEPTTIEELQEVVKEASISRTPLTVAGAGTGLTGARVPQGGWVVSLNRFRAMEIDGQTARCGAGVILADLQAAAGRQKLFFGPNPTETSASIGGIISTNAGGARSFRFGPVRQHVLALQVTFMDGRTVRLKKEDRVAFPFHPVTTPATTKNAAGYCLKPDLDWIDLLVGSEGTLGIITEADLRLLPEPAALLGGVVFFQSQERMLNAVDAWRSIHGLRLLESMDDMSLKFLRPRYPDIAPQANAALLIEQDLYGPDDPEIDAWIGRLESQAAMAEESWFGMNPAERERFREFRHVLPTMMVDHGRRSGIKYGTDFAVPLAKSRELYAYYRQRCEALFPDSFAIFGHAGDANVHVNLLARGPEDAKTAETLMQDFARFTISLGGTIAAEHGVGKHKTNLLRMMYGSKDIEAMKAIKRRLDSDWLLGRGTIFDC
jgi:FAD/FMN-containing dehydrogenase